MRPYAKIGKAEQEESRVTKNQIVINIKQPIRVIKNPIMQPNIKIAKNDKNMHVI